MIQKVSACTSLIIALVSSSAANAQSDKPALLPEMNGVLWFTNAIVSSDRSFAYIGSRDFGVKKFDIGTQQWSGWLNKGMRFENGYFYAVFAIVVDPNNSERIMVVTTRELLRSDDGGLSFYSPNADIKNLIGDRKFTYKAMEQVGDKVYLLIDDTIYKSADFGTTWKARQDGISPGAQLEVAGGSLKISQLPYGADVEILDETGKHLTTGYELMQNSAGSYALLSKTGRMVKQDLYCAPVETMLPPSKPIATVYGSNYAIETGDGQFLLASNGTPIGKNWQGFYGQQHVLLIDCHNQTVQELTRPHNSGRLYMAFGIPASEGTWDIYLNYDYPGAGMLETSDFLSSKYSKEWYDALLNRATEHRLTWKQQITIQH